MPRIVRAGLIQATLCEPATSPTAKIKEAMIAKHVALTEEAAGKGVQVSVLPGAFLRAVFLRGAEGALV
jgi:beta-ureidopropionase